MKELSIEQKAKAYDEALKRARQFSEHPLQEDSSNIVEYIFPELKESEDERIRKELLEHCKNQAKPYTQTGNKCLQIQSWIEWLKKQGTPAKLSEEEQNRFAKVVLSNCALSFINYLDAHKYEGKMCVSNGECEDIENAFHNAMWDRLHRYYCKYIKNQGEHKFTDKIEPKFHEGEWITNGDYTWKIVEVKPLDYILQSQEGNIVDDTISHVDEQFHSFSIKDAKDGDVLACPLPKGCESGGQIFIFKEINSRDYVENCIEYYCRVCEGEFYENKTGYMGTTSSPIYPATKEQRDTLFSKMKEAGYEWDDGKKELKKIELRDGVIRDILDSIDTFEVKDPYEQCVQYDSIKSGIQAHAETYSFNIESKLFNQLTKEQQELWREEIEQACISGGEVGVELARDPRYKENFEVKKIDLEKEIIQFLDTYFPDAKIGHKLSLRRTAKHFFVLGLNQKENKL